MKPSEFLRALRRRLWSQQESLLLMRPAGRLPDESRRKPCPGSFQMVTEDNIMDCATFEDAARYTPIYRRMLEAGDLVWYGYIDGVCCCRLCLQKSGSFDCSGVLVRTLASEESYIQYVYCDPKYRGNGLHTAGVHHFCTAYPNHTIYTLVEETNKASLHGFARNGFEVTSRLVVKNRFLFRWLREQKISKAESDAILSR